MSIGDSVRRRWPKDWPLQAIPPVSWTEQRPTYREASPAIIDAALDRSQRKPTGNWYAFAASRDVRAGRPSGTRVAGVELVAWRDQESRLHVGPRSCPHLGADLATAAVHDGALICRWHGLCLDANTDEFGWRTLPSYDDGVLAWVRLDGVGGETPLDRAGDPGQADRRHAGRRRPSGRHLRTLRHHRQPPRPVAWRVVSPLLVHPTRGADHPDRRGRPVPGRGDLPHRPRRRAHRRGVHQPGGTHHRDAHPGRRGSGQRRRNSCHTTRFGPGQPSAHRGDRSRRRPFRPHRFPGGHATPRRWSPGSCASPRRGCGKTTSPTPSAATSCAPATPDAFCALSVSPSVRIWPTWRICPAADFWHCAGRAASPCIFRWSSGASASSCSSCLAR